MSKQVRFRMRFPSKELKTLTKFPDSSFLQCCNFCGGDCSIRKDPQIPSRWVFSFLTCLQNRLAAISMGFWVLHRGHKVFRTGGRQTPSGSLKFWNHKRRVIFVETFRRSLKYILASVCLRITPDCTILSRK